MSRRREYKREDNFDRVADMARSAYRIGLEIKDMINTEHKQYLSRSTGAVGTYQISYNGTTPVILNDPAQGVASNQRTGDSIKCQTLTLRFTLNANTTIAGAGTFANRLVIWWQEDNTTAITLANMFTDMGTVRAPLSLKTYDNRFTTKILHDEYYACKAADTSATGAANMVHTVVLPINKHTQFDTATQTIVTGCLRMAWINEQVSATDITVDYVAGLSFTDD